MLAPHRLHRRVQDATRVPDMCRVERRVDAAIQARVDSTSHACRHRCDGVEATGQWVGAGGGAGLTRAYNDTRGHSVGTRVSGEVEFARLCVCVCGRGFVCERSRV